MVTKSTKFKPMKNKVYLFFIAVLFAPSGLYASSESNDKSLKELEENITEIFNDEDMVGASVAIIHDQSIWFSKGKVCI